MDSGLGSVRRAISASFGRRPRFGLPTQVQRDVAETLSVVGTKLLSFYHDDPFERDVGNIVQAVFFQFVHNTRQRGKALLGALVAALVA